MARLFKYLLPALLWAIIILFLTLLPVAAMPEVPEWELISFATVSHAVVFFILALLLHFGLGKQNFNYNLRRYSSWVTLVVSVLFGMLIEYLQSSMGWGRQGDIMDVVSNSIGTVAGILFYTLAGRRLLPNLL